MARIPEEKISEIRDRIDIVELVGRYLTLKPAGDNHKGLCPFHNEKSPSFNVNASRQIFHCFGCGEGGNAISFVMKLEGLSFPAAAKQLAAEVGVEIEEEQLSPAEQEQRKQRERLQRINEIACSYFQEQLLQAEAGETGRKYLQQRGYNRACAESFRLGFAPDRWEGLAGHLAQQNQPLEAARQLGLIRPGQQGRGDYDLFRGRLIFPILDGYGQVVAFGGRVLDDGTPKYINSPESPLYHKSRVLYGLYQAKEPIRRQGEAIVVEGYFDLLALQNAGIEQVVATCGTALTREHARLLKRYAKRIVLLFDQDQAGQAAAIKALDGLLPEGLEVQLAELPQGEDPDSLLQQEGPEGLRRRLDMARPLLELLAERQLAASENDVNARARSIDALLQWIRLLPNKIEQQLHLKRLAEQTGLAPDLLARQPDKGAERSRPNRTGPGPERARPKTAPPRTAFGTAQELLLQLLVWEPELKERVVNEGGTELFSDPDQQQLAHLLLQQDENGDPANLLDNDQLEAAQKAILSGILIKNRAPLADQSEKILLDCRQTLERDRLRRRSRELPQLITQAMTAGEQTQLADLQREQEAINRRLKSPDSH